MRLEDYIELTHGDKTVPHLASLPKTAHRPGDCENRRILIYERADQFEILSRIPTTYMWTSPEPRAILEQWGLEQKKCASNRRYRDTEEYRDRRKVKKLAAKADIRQYYEVLRSQELKDFLAFMETPEAQHLADKRAARKSPALQRFRRFASSKAYRVYTRLHGSYIIQEYEKAFDGIGEQEAADLSNLTKGYAFAYQVVGILYAKYRDLNKMIGEFDQYMSLFVYDKIWESLPGKQRKVLFAFSKENEGTASLRQKAGLGQKEFSVYRDRLLRRGLLDGSKRGQLSFVLPRFFAFVARQID